jgi:hypothetical protein
VSYLLPLLLLLVACGPSVEDNLDAMDRGGVEAEQARISLLLSKDAALDPLLAALESPRHEASHLELIEVLASLMLRSTDPRLAQALQRRLRTDSDPRVRANVIYQLSIRDRVELLDDFLVALEDTDADVRFHAIAALTPLRPELSPVQDDILRLRTQQLTKADHQQTQQQALLLAGEYVSEWVDEARQLALTGQVAEAESLFHRALAYFPTNKKANHRLGRHYFDHGEPERGLQVFRDSGMLLEVPPTVTAPVIDGRLDEAMWQEVAFVDTLYTHPGEMMITLPSQVRTTVLIGYGQDALYLGAHCYDPRPQELVIGQVGDDYVYLDQVEFIFDPSVDYRTFGQIIITSAGDILELWTAPGRGYDGTWEPEVEAAAYVGDDFWSVECRIPYGQKGFPQPHSGDIWNFNAIRLFRGRDYSQWIVSFRDGSSHADKLGFLLFK